MSMGRKAKARQAPLWVPSQTLAGTPKNPFYDRLNNLFDQHKFDLWVEDLCEPYFSPIGRDSIPPGVYFRMLFIGFFEGITSERQIAWRCADSRSLGTFLGYQPHEATPDHSTLPVWRKRLDEAAYDAVFQWILAMLNKHGKLDGSRVGVDSTTIEADAAMRKLVRKDTRENYREFVRRLAEEAGEPADTMEQLIRFDRKRKGKSLKNTEWESTTDPDARVMNMKDGRTRMGHKPEHAVDLETGAIVAAVVYPGDEADVDTLLPSIEAARENLQAVSPDLEILEAVADKGYHSVDNIKELGWDEGITPFIPERETGKRRKWKGDTQARGEFHANRQRCRSEKGKRLGRARSEKVERSFAHVCDTGGMHRLTTRGRENGQKRYLMYAAAFNLALLMRALFGAGKPRAMAERRKLAFLIAFFAALLAHLMLFDE